MSGRKDGDEAASGSEVLLVSPSGAARNKQKEEKMRSTMIVLAACLLLVGLASAQLDEEWVAEYDRTFQTGSDIGQAIAVDGSGYACVAGYTFDSRASRYSYVTIKYDPATGETLWVRYYSNPAKYDVATAIAADASGNVYVTGKSDASGTGSDYATIKYDANGNQLWAARYDGPGHGTDWPCAIAVDANGNVLVTGHSTGSATGLDYATVKYGPNGNIVWTQYNDGAARYNGPGNDYDRPYALAVDASGNAYVTGFSYGGVFISNDFATIKYTAGGNIAWTQYSDGAARYNGPGNGPDGGSAIAVDASGDVLVTGGSTGVGQYTNMDFTTIRYDADGDIVWTQYPGGAARYNGPGNGTDAGSAVAVDASGNAYVTGSCNVSSSNMFDYATIKYTPTGDIAWTQYPGGAARYNGPGNGADYANALALDASGNAYVSGQSVGSGITNDCATIKYTPTGDVAWTQYSDGAARYNGPVNGSDAGRATAIDAGGNLFVAGQSDAGTSPEGTQNVDFLTIKYSGGGSQGWAVRFTMLRHADDRGQKVAFDALGNVYVAGQTGTQSGWYDYVTIKYDPGTGDTLWARSYGYTSPAGMDQATAIAVDALGNAHVTGYSDGPNGIDYATIKYEPDGDVAWTQYASGAARYNGPANRGGDYAYAIAVDGSGNVCVTGSSYGDYATVKYDAGGNQLWVARYDGPAQSSDFANAITMDADGNVYVTGHSASLASYPYNYDYATVKYSSSGVQLWARRYDGPGNGDDQAVAIAVDASGNVYVTGASDGGFSITGTDYATVKYDADGNTVWTQYTGGAARYTSESNFSDQATAMAVDAAGNAYVTGRRGGSNADYATIKYAPNGDLAWTQYSDGAARYSGPGFRTDQAMAIALNSVGVFVTGRSQGSTSAFDYATAMYDPATGDQLGDAMRYTGPGANPDYALSIAVGPAGAVAVTGQSRVPVQNELIENYNIVTIKYSTGTADVGGAEILEPSGLIDTLHETPSVLVKNYGTRKVSFVVWFEIKDPTGTVRYSESVNVTDLAGGTEFTVSSFPEWDVPNDLEGLYAARAWTVLPGDIDPSNDQATLTFGVEAAPQKPAQWVRWQDVPEGPQRRVVQHGSCAATDPEGRYLYLLKGDNTCEFYRYDPATLTWTTLEPIPEYGRDGVPRTVKEGGTLAQIGGKFYATKGGNSTEFWEYDPAATPGSHWTQLADAPGGTHSGASACGVSILSNKYIYLLRGAATFDFYRYSVAGNSWEAMADAPGIAGEEFKLGSSITYDGVNTIYVLKGILNKFYTYAVATNTWAEKPDLPFGLKNKQAKGGAAICYHLRKVYCIKGSNSQEFWIYDCNTSTWAQDGDVPLGDDKTRVQDGGTLVYLSQSRYLYATKGGTLELWSYGKLSNIGVQSGEVISLDGAVKRFSLAVGPSVTSSRARVHYAIPKATNVSLRLYEVTGRCVAVLHDGRREPGRYSADVDAGSLARGVYILKLQSDACRLTRKVVVE
jgi:uncharacterized delta-60 repeat protein